MTKKRNDQPGVRQLDNAIVLLLLLILFFFIVAALAQFWQKHVDETRPFFDLSQWGPTMDGNVLGYFLWIPIIGGIIWYFLARAKKKEEFEKSPEHPFKVKVAVEPIKDNAVISVLRGRKITHQLEMDIKISPKDWKRIDEAGLMDAPLFKHPNENDT